MRAVKTVISVAGNLKRENPNMDERQICLRALRDVNVPKFLKDDLKLFNGTKLMEFAPFFTQSNCVFSGIVSDLFPRMVEEAVDYGALELAIRNSCLVLGLEDVKGEFSVVLKQFCRKALSRLCAKSDPVVRNHCSSSWFNAGWAHWVGKNEGKFFFKSIR